MKSPVFLLFVALLFIIIFVEGIMIIDQELRIKAMKERVREVTGEVGETIERANQFISMQEAEKATSSQATSTDIKK